MTHNDYNGLCEIINENDFERISSDYYTRTFKHKKFDVTLTIDQFNNTIIVEKVDFFDNPIRKIKTIYNPTPDVLFKYFRKIKIKKLKILAQRKNIKTNK